MKRRVNVIGVGVTRFSLALDGPEPLLPAIEAGRRALEDAGPVSGHIRLLLPSYAAQVAGSDTLAAGLGLSAIAQLPADDLTGVSALRAAIQVIEQGRAECVLAIGFDCKAADAALHCDESTGFQGFPDPASARVTPAVAYLGRVAEGYLRRYRMREEICAMVAMTARAHAAANPDAAFGQRLSLEEVMEAGRVAGPLTRPQFCTKVRGAAALLLCSNEFARSNGIVSPVYVAGHASQRDGGETAHTDAALVLYERDVAAAQQVYEQSGSAPQEIDVCELHDDSSIGAIILYEALGLCREGQADKFIEDGDNTYGGNMVVGPSGGLLGNGLSLAASDLVQCAELVRQLRGQAGARQVPGARVALQHHRGPGMTSEVTLYRRD